MSEESRPAFAPDDLVIGDDGRPRCSWGSSSEDYVKYHDDEWGRPTIDERTLFEKICLEGFQSGLSWITILRKRENFRLAFSNFDSAEVSGFDDADVDRLLADAGIVRHRGKINATINNARCLEAMHAAEETLSGLIWSFEPGSQLTPKSFAEVAATTVESTALSKALKAKGFQFVGPTTAYAAMQAMGVVNDHLDGCWVREECLADRARTVIG